jgi:hypothetical protein
VITTARITMSFCTEPIDIGSSNMTHGRFLDTLVVTRNFLGGDGRYEAMVKNTTAAAVVVTIVMMMVSIRTVT